MQSNEQKLREALQAYQDANEMSPYGDYSKIEWESSAGLVNPSWGGGDCKKHGRWYGRCYSCSDEWDNLRKRADRDAYTARENALNAAKQMARVVLALPTADHERSGPSVEFDLGETSSHTVKCVWSKWDAKANKLVLCLSVRDIETAAPVGELPAPAEYFVFAGLDWHRATAAYFNSCSGEKLALYTADQMRAYARAAIAKATGATHE